jgi:hypothetical protein
MKATLADSMMDEMRNVINSALGSTATLKGRDGTVPASIGAGDSGSVIANIALGNPVFLGVSGGSCGLNGSTDDTNTGAGTVTYWRMYDSSVGTIFQWTEGADFVTDDPSFASGDTCHIVDITLAFTISPPDA